MSLCCDKRTLNNALLVVPHTDFIFQTRIHVMRKSDGSLLKTCYTTDPLFLFHHINAYEDSGHAVVDVCDYYNADIVYALSLDSDSFKTEDFPEVFVRRYVLPLDTDKVSACMQSWMCRWVLTR